MHIKKLFIIAQVLISFVSQGQYLTQNAEGKGAIPLPLNGLGTSIDIGKTEVAFGLNNYEKVFASNKGKGFLGINVLAKSSDGLANLFNSGDIVAGGSLSTFLGYSFSNNQRLLDSFKSKYDIDSLTQIEIKMQNILFREYKASLIQSIEKHINKIDDKDLRTKVQIELSDSIWRQTTLVDGSLKFIITGYENKNNALDIFRVLLIKDEKESHQNFVDKNRKMRGEISALIDHQIDLFIKNEWPVRLTTFIQGGIEARNFTRFLKIETTNFSKSFQDTLYRGGNFGVGLNLQIKNFWIGATYSYLKRDNFISLNSKEYIIRTTDTSVNQSLLQEKKITAYTGKYSRVETNELNIDVVGDFKLSDTARLLANAYLRGSLFSRDTSFLKNYLNLGVGLYFIGKKGKFLGGLYAELPDINNNLEKAKASDEINLRPPFKKLTFGIVTKINLSSVFMWANRPANPD